MPASRLRNFAVNNGSRYEVNLVGRKDIPNFSPTNRRFHSAQKLWQHLP